MDYFQTNALHLSIMILPLELGPLPSPPPHKKQQQQRSKELDHKANTMWFICPFHNYEHD